MSRLELAKAAGIDSSMVSQYEADAKTPREDTLARLAAFLQVTPAWLRYGVGDGPSAAPQPVVFDPAVDERVPDEEVSEEIAREAARKPGAREQAANGHRKRR